MTEQSKFSLAASDGRVFLSARQADLAEVLEALSKQAGFALSFYQRPSQSLTAEMGNVTVEDCLKKIIPSYSFVYRKGKGGDLVLQSVAVFRAGPLALLSAPSSGKTVAYGSRPEQLGRVFAPGVERQGPASFAADEGGNIYVCDTVNGRIKAFSPEGKTILDIAAPGAVTDLALDEAGNIFALDSLSGRVAVYDPSGRPLGSLTVPAERLSRVQNIRCVKDRIYLLGRDQEEFEIGGLEKGELRGRDSFTPSAGMRAESGRFYTALKDSDSFAQLEARGGKEESSRKIGLPIPRLASVSVLGEDASGNIYLQIEQSREKGPGIDLGVIKLDREGNMVALLEKIPNNYVNWTARLLRINRAGEVLQMLPGPEAVALNRWNWERKGEK